VKNALLLVKYVADFMIGMEYTGLTNKLFL